MVVEENFFNVIEKRRSVRSFLKKEIESDKVDKILNTIVSAPSAGNLQAYKVFLISDEKVIFKMARAAYNQMFIAEAPICLVFCADKNHSGAYYGNRGRDLYSIQDATVAVTYGMLAAEALELSSVWIGAFDTNSVIDILTVEKDLLPVAILPIGYAAETPPKTGRKNIDEIVEKI